MVGICGADGVPNFWLSPNCRGDAREDHLAFQAESREVVEAVHHSF